MKILKRLPVLCVLALMGCGIAFGPNFFPRDDLSFEAADNADAVRKVEGIVEATGLSAFPFTPSTNFNAGIGHPLEQVAEWKWPGRPSFTVGIIRRLPPDKGYWVNIEDSQTDGFTFAGPACQKYLELAAALKAQSGIGSHHAGGENCDMSRKNSN
ncbi:MAG TPA: hypothetical protein VHX92_08595 [Rhizomicrobium sp.]|nr:hypothetical protein [Rhizomicrobium sp.]